MSVTTLKRCGKNTYCGMLTSSGKPNWNEETMLLRFVEENGCSTLFLVSGAALQQFAELEKERIYDIEMPGACVKSCNTQKKYGIHNTVEVRASFAFKITLSKKAWPLAAQYRFVTWLELNQKEFLR